MRAGWVVGVLAVLWVKSVLAQSAAKPPTGVMPPVNEGADSPAAAASGTAGTAPVTPPAPQAPPAPPAAPAPATAIVVPPGMALVPISALSPPAAVPAPAAPPEPAAESETPAFDSARKLAPAGFFVDVSLGDGQPFGAQTFGGGVSATGGLGGQLFAGYAFHPNFGFDLFTHYNAASLAYPSSAQPAPDSSGHLLAYGAEARAMASAGVLTGWLSLGVAAGSLSSHTVLNDSYYSATVDYKVDLKLAPVLSTGVEYLVSPHFGIGPQARWYFTSYDKPCETGSSTYGAPFGGAPVTQNIDRCAASSGGEKTPDIVYIGFGATFYQR